MTRTFLITLHVVMVAVGVYGGFQLFDIITK